MNEVSANLAEHDVSSHRPPVCTEYRTSSCLYTMRMSKAPFARSGDGREVPLEVYVNGELFLIDSVWVPDEENMQVDLMVTDSIYDLLGCLPGDTTQLEVDDEGMSVSHAALEGEDLHLDITCNSTETTTGWIARKINGFIRTLFWMNPAPEPEVNLVTVHWPAEVPENEKDGPKRVIKKMSACPKYFPIDPAEPLCDPVTEPELDLPGPKESCVPDANVPDTEPVSAEDRKVDVSDGMNASPEMSGPGESTKDKKMSPILKYFPLDPPDTEPVSAEDRKVDVRDGMNASPEMSGPGESTKDKMKAFLKKYFPLDPPDTEPVSAEDRKVDVSDGMNASPEMNGPGESTKDKKMRAFLKKYFPLDAPDTEPVSAEDRKVDVRDGMNASPEMNGPGESTKDKMKAFFKKYFPLDAPDTEPVSAEDRKVDVRDGMNASPEMNGPGESTKDKISAFLKKYFPLDAPDTEPVSAEDRKVDVSDGMNASPEMNGPGESTKDKKMSAFFKKYFPLDLAEPSCVPVS
ncbi:uncharacterized protein [Pseudorasbora parva]|uniref:uncharacterized protein n=1 Tax=Pseudorasbora parva TaxID=51549 RepID=UPI00351EF69D